MTFLFGILALTGFSFSLWLFISLIRAISEKIHPIVKKKAVAKKNTYSLKDVAVIIPAHNEETVITRTLQAMLRVIPKEQIYVASDYSTDRTIQICRSFTVNYVDINPNLGKARALVYTMKKFKLFEKYKLLLINDADSEIDRNYLRYALPLFNDPQIAAVAGHGVSRVERYSFLQAFFIAYRLRLWRVVQFGMRYGQTWKHVNLNFIIPGAFSMYRTNVLKQLEIDAPGLIIEDFNMTFELHKKKLGKIAYSPKIFGVHQDPDNLRDYVRQVQRWNMGYFQTVKRHGIWASKFWLMTTIYNLELYSSALLLAITPAVFISFILNGFYSVHIPYLYEDVGFMDFLFGLFLIDYLLTVFVMYFEKKPMLLVYGLGFFFLRYIDALIYIGSPIVAWFTKSSGTWKSPKRV